MNEYKLEQLLVTQQRLVERIDNLERVLNILIKKFEDNADHQTKVLNAIGQQLMKINEKDRNENG